MRVEWLYVKLSIDKVEPYKGPVMLTQKQVKNNTEVL